MVAAKWSENIFARVVIAAVTAITRHRITNWCVVRLSPCWNGLRWIGLRLNGRSCLETVRLRGQRLLGMGLGIGLGNLVGQFSKCFLHYQIQTVHDCVLSHAYFLPTFVSQNSILHRRPLLVWIQHFKLLDIMISGDESRKYVH